MTEQIILSAGQTHVILPVLLRDSGGLPVTGVLKTDLTVAYFISGAGAAVNVSSQVNTYAGAGTISSWDAFCWKEVSSSNYPGKYVLHIPDALISSSSSKATLLIQSISSAFLPEEIEILLNPNVVVDDYSTGGIQATKDIMNAVDVLGAIEGAGFNTLTASLAALRAKYNADLSPIIATSLGSSDVEFISRMVHLIRLETDEPSVDAKYTVSDLIQMIEQSFQVALADLNALTDAPLKVRHVISLTSGQSEYQLPPSVEQIIRISRLDPTTNLPLTMWVQRPESSWAAPGFRLEGRSFIVDPPWNGENIDLEIMYIPNGDFRLHYATATTWDSTHITFPTTPTVGTRDTRTNAYVGAVIRVLSATDTAADYLQEATITAYDRLTRIATFSPALSPVPDSSGGKTIKYEVVPNYTRLVEAQVSLHVAERIIAASGNARKFQLIEKQHAKVKRAIMMQLSKMENIAGDHFDNRTGFNPEGTSWR